MSFDRYLHDDHNAGAADFADFTYQDPNPQSSFAGSVDSSTAISVQFQMPQFMLNGPPALASDVGAEMFPGMFNDPNTSSWLDNNGFSTEPFEEKYVYLSVCS
jgi:hypothetical protein